MNPFPPKLCFVRVFYHDNKTKLGHLHFGNYRQERQTLWKQQLSATTLYFYAALHLLPDLLSKPGEVGQILNKSETNNSGL